MQKQLKKFKIRKWYEFFEEILLNETYQVADGDSLKKFAIGAVFSNPYSGKFSKDLSLLIDPSESLGFEFGERLLRIAKDCPIISYGKACIVGLNGEYEHGNACLTSSFAEPIRKAIGGAKAWIPSTGKLGYPGMQIDIPLAHKDALYVRSNYDTFTLAFNDAPKSGEIIVIFACATRGRLHARLGGLKAKDILGNDGLR